VYASSSRTEALREPLIQASEEIPSEDMGAQQEADVENGVEGLLPTELGSQEDEGRLPANAAGMENEMPSEAVLMMGDEVIASDADMEGEMPKAGFFARLLGKNKSADYQKLVN